MPAVGLDFGTSTTLVAAGHGVVPIGSLDPWMPSLVGFADDGSIVVGEDAEHAAVESVARSVKRTITERREFVRLSTPTGERDIRADDLMVEVLREASRRGRARLGHVTGEFRLGCPAMWDGPQRRRLVDLARRAGLPVTLASLVDEPVAAGIAWLAGQALETDEPVRLLVFDMGGGTLDIAVLDAVSHVDGHPEVSVLAAVGAAEAGDDLDRTIAKDLEFSLAAHGVDVDSLSHPARARGRLLGAAREIKVALTTATEHMVGLPRRLFGLSDLDYTRDQLEDVFIAQMDRAEEYVAAALRVAQLAEIDPGSAYDIARTSVDTLVRSVDVVLLSGGMSQIPYVAQRMRWLFPESTRIELAGTPPENAVALGLARSTDYGRISRYRPAFDIVVEWDRGRHTRRLYEAYTPLVEPRQILRGARDLRYVRTGSDLSLPAKGKGKLKVVSHTDEPVRASVGGRDLNGFAVAFSEEKFEFSLYPNGSIRLTDGTAAYEGLIALSE